MGMHGIDWCITVGLLLILTAAALVEKRYTQSVADFLAANRCAGRYLITISASTAGLGALSFIAFFEAYYKAGFSAAWWSSASGASAWYAEPRAWPAAWAFPRSS